MEKRNNIQKAKPKIWKEGMRAERPPEELV
jgi:hypothetical protein